MTGRYSVRLFDTAGTQIAIFDDFNSLYYFQRLNDTHTHTISIDGSDPRRAMFVPDAMVEVMRSDPDYGVPWAVEYAGFHRTSQDQTTDKGDNLFTSFGRSYLDLLSRLEILYYAGSAGDVKSGPADDVMKAYANENLGAIATVGNGRLRDGVMPGFSVSANLGAGPTWAGANAYKNVLAGVQDVAKSSLVDLGVTRTGAATFRFDTFYPRIGTDRTGAGAAAPVVFAPELSNMSAPYAIESHTDEVNDIIVLGQGEQTNRAFREVIDTTSATTSPWNRIERTLDARNSSTNAQLDSAGASRLNALRATRLIKFTVLQTAGVVYGRDYFLGDLVLAKYRGLQAVKKVLGVEVTVADGRESIRIHFDDETAGIA